MLLKVLVNHQSLEFVQGFLLGAVTGCWVSYYQMKAQGKIANWMLWAGSTWSNYMCISAFEGMLCLQSIWKNQCGSLGGSLKIQGPHCGLQQ